MPDPQLVRERAVLIDYLRVKTEAEDWHAVADAAMDLREIDAQLHAADHIPHTEGNHPR